MFTTIAKIFLHTDTWKAILALHGIMTLVDSVSKIEFGTCSASKVITKEEAEELVKSVNIHSYELLRDNNDANILRIVCF